MSRSGAMMRVEEEYPRQAMLVPREDSEKRKKSEESVMAYGFSLSCEHASISTSSMVELLESSELEELRLPYYGKSAAWRLMSGHGRCIQGVNGSSTHRGTLAYSFDFKLAVGTPVVAVRSGWIAAVVSHFAGGGARAHLAPRANFVAVKHADGTYARYYHLKRDGAAKVVGEAVAAGEVVGYSGNTGYTGGPHLHLDVVNVLPEETSVLRFRRGPTRDWELVPSIAAAFSQQLPTPEAPLVARLVYFPNEPDAWPCLAENIPKPFVALADRDATMTFSQRIAALAMLGAAAAVVANNRSGPEMFAMGGCEQPTATPAVLISRESAATLKRLAMDDQSGCEVELAAHPAVAHAAPLRDQVKGLDKVPFSCVYGPDLRYVTRTIPVKFRSATSRRRSASSIHKKKSFVPQQANIYPPVLTSSSFARCCRSHDDALRPSETPTLH